MKIVKKFFRVLFLLLKLIWIAFILYMIYRAFYFVSIGDREKAMLNLIGACSGVTFLTSCDD